MDVHFSKAVVKLSSIGILDFDRLYLLKGSADSEVAHDGYRLPSCGCPSIGADSKASMHIS